MNGYYDMRCVASQVCALLAGGGYAEKVAVAEGQVLPVPPGISLKDAASFPEVACTVWSTIFMTSRLSKGETLLVSRMIVISSSFQEKKYNNLFFPSMVIGYFVIDSFHAFDLTV
jgi:hypothetical protein